MCAFKSLWSFDFSINENIYAELFGALAPALPFSCAGECISGTRLPSTATRGTNSRLEPLDGNALTVA